MCLVLVCIGSQSDGLFLSFFSCLLVLLLFCVSVSWYSCALYVSLWVCLLVSLSVGVVGYDGVSMGLVSVCIGCQSRGLILCVSCCLPSMVLLLLLLGHHVSGIVLHWMSVGGSQCVYVFVCLAGCFSCDAVSWYCCAFDVSVVVSLFCVIRSSAWLPPVHVLCLFSFGCVCASPLCLVSCWNPLSTSVLLGSSFTPCPTFLFLLLVSSTCMVYVWYYVLLITHVWAPSSRLVRPVCFFVSFCLPVLLSLCSIASVSGYLLLSVLLLSFLLLFVCLVGLSMLPSRCPKVLFRLLLSLSSSVCLPLLLPFLLCLTLRFLRSSSCSFSSFSASSYASSYCYSYSYARRHRRSHRHSLSRIRWGLCFFLLLLYIRARGPRKFHRLCLPVLFASVLLSLCFLRLVVHLALLALVLME